LNLAANVNRCPLADVCSVYLFKIKANGHAYKSPYSVHYMSSKH